VYLFCLVIWAFCAAEGSAQNKDSLVFNTEIGLYNRYIWRGINFGDAPSLQGTCSLAYRGFEAGFSGANSLSGTALGYANTLEVFANYTYRGFMVGVSDNFFYEAFALPRRQVEVHAYAFLCAGELQFLQPRLEQNDRDLLRRGL
jgi:hypothetical protein